MTEAIDAIRDAEGPIAITTAVKLSDHCLLHPPSLKFRHSDNRLNPPHHATMATTCARSRFYSSSLDSSSIPRRRKLAPDCAATSNNQQPCLCTSKRRWCWRISGSRQDNGPFRSFGLLLFVLLCLIAIPSFINAQDETQAPTAAESGETVTSSPTEVVVPPTATPISPTSPSPSEATNSTNAPSAATEPPDIGTTVPTSTAYPTGMPSIVPSGTPTFSVPPTTSPSVSPTARPSFSEPVISNARFSQRFDVGNGREFKDEEIVLFQGLYRSYTTNFAPPGAVSAGQVTTTCTVDEQLPLVDDSQERLVQLDNVRRQLTLQRQRYLRRNTKLHDQAKKRRHSIASNENSHTRLESPRGNRTQNRNNSSSSSSISSMTAWRHLQTENVQVIQLDYTMSYSSAYFNVSSYPILFQNYVNSNLENVANQLRTLGLNVTVAQTASRIIERTPAPSVSPAPSIAPTGNPTSTYFPSEVPTIAPSAVPTVPESPAGGGRLSPAVFILLSILIAAVIIGTGAFFICRERRKTREEEFHANAMKKTQQGQEGLPGREGGGWDASGGDGENASNHLNGNNSDSPEANLMYGSAFRQNASSIEAQDQELSAVGGAIVSPTESRVSNQSLLSAGRSMEGDSGDEADSTQIFADEFDQYKDQNLESMRADIVGNLEDGDGMMNQAVARALMDNYNEEDGVDQEGEPIDYIWGCPEGCSGPEIEAGALFSVVDWLDQNKSASAEEKRSYMIETLNKMVVSVRKGYVGPADASRTIHESGALLGVQLAAEMPSTTIVVSGMRENATAQDITTTFNAFGQVATAAVSPNQRGFGILRFSKDDAVETAMDKYRTSEVFVQDKAVELKPIQPEDAAKENGGSNGNSNVP